MGSTHRLVIEHVPIDSLSQHPENANNGDVDVIEESIRVNGLYKPVIVQRSTGHILAGNHTFVALIKSGAHEVPVIYLDVDDRAAKRIMLADNQTARRAQDDEAQLWNLLDDIRGTDEGLAGTGFDYRDLEYLDSLMREPLTLDEVREEALDLAVDGAEKRTRGHRLGFSLTPTVAEDGTCESITLSRPDFRPITAADFLALRRALGMDPLPRAKLADMGVPAWEER